VVKTIKAMWDWLGDLEGRLVDWADGRQERIDKL